MVRDKSYIVLHTCQTRYMLNLHCALCSASSMADIVSEETIFRFGKEVVFNKILDTNVIPDVTLHLTTRKLEERASRYRSDSG